MAPHLHWHPSWDDVQQALKLAVSLAEAIARLVSALHPH
jgi:hypothetical protein